MLKHLSSKLFGRALALVVLFVAAARPAAANPKDEEAIKGRVAEFIAVFNKGDAQTLATFWTDDATLVNPLGQTGKGRAEVEKVLASDIATILKDTKMEMKVVEFRALGNEAAWIEIEHSVVGAKGPDGKAMPPLTFHVPTLMVKKGKTWLIAEARPYAYLPPPPAAPAMAAAKK